MFIIGLRTISCSLFPLCSFYDNFVASDCLMFSAMATCNGAFLEISAHMLWLHVKEMIVAVY